MKIKIEVYGASGCKKCSKLKETVEEIVEENDIDGEVSKVENPTKLAEKGIMSTPALSIDGDVKFKGRAPGKEELKEIIEQ